jgi:hypothetical protein
LIAFRWPPIILAFRQLIRLLIAIDTPLCFRDFLLSLRFHFLRWFSAFQFRYLYFAFVIAAAAISIRHFRGREPPLPITPDATPPPPPAAAARRFALFR